MKHIIFNTNPDNKYSIAVLIKESSFNKSKLETHYITPLIDKGITPDSIIGLSLKYNEHGKCPAKLIKEHLKVILEACNQLQTKTLLVADSNYFKTLTKERKAEPHFGYIKKCAIEGYEHISVILSVNYQALFYNPVSQDKLDMSINTLVDHTNNTHVDLGTNIIHSEYYPSTNDDIDKALGQLHQHPVLTCDIETYSLAFNEAGIGTIAFAWSQHEGIAFCVDTKRPHYSSIGGDTLYSFKYKDKNKRKLLLKFLMSYKGTLIYHGGTFDIKILIYELFMLHNLDNRGLIKGLNVMYKSIHDTKIITYLATNTTAGNKLGLKHNAFEFAGNYAQEDIKDISKIPISELLKYNLVDALATWYVYNKNYPIMVQDNQLDLYNTIMIPSMKVITHMELTGMPMDYDEILKTSNRLNSIHKQESNKLLNSKLIKDYEWRVQTEAMIEKNLLLKIKVKPLKDFYEQFNPASNKQLRELLYEDFELKITDTTDTGLPATGNKTLKKLLNNLIQQHNITEEELK